MRRLIFSISAFVSILCYGQVQNIEGTYSNILRSVEVTFNKDSTFQYVTKEKHPIFWRWENFSEMGNWCLLGDTIILNPRLTKKTYVESLFNEEEFPGNENIQLTFNHIKRYFDATNNIVRADTVQIERLDYSFNEFKKKARTRVAPQRTSRCTFAGYIPNEVITKNRTIFIQRPVKPIKSIFIGCYELQGTKEFAIKNPNSNHLTLDVYSNYFLDGQIRQMKFLIKNSSVLYTKQLENGEFPKDNIWKETEAKLKKGKAGLNKIVLLR